MNDLFLLSEAQLTGKVFDPLLLKVRVQKPKMRRTLGYFIENKFGTHANIQKLAECGFAEGQYKKVVVTWDWTAEAKAAADAEGIELWDFRRLMQDIANSIRNTRSYFTDDTLRTINLFARALADTDSDLQTNLSKPGNSKSSRDPIYSQKASAPYWVYRNWIHERARLHKATCSHCNNGAGTQNSSNSVTGEWKSFPSEANAKKFLLATRYKGAKLCGVCMGD